MLVTEVRALTGVRGLAAILVVLFHFSYPNRPFGPAYLAVDLFFILSGFLMGMNYASFFATGFSFTAYARFLHKRIARVYPLYLTTVLLVIVLLRATGERPAKIEMASNALMVQALGPGLIRAYWGTSLDLPSWSVSTELGSYLIFPALVSLSVVRGQSRALVTALVAFACLAAVTRFHPDAPYSHELLNVTSGLPALVRCIAGFSLGLFTWRYRKRIGAVNGGWGALAIASAILALWYVPGMDLAIVGLFMVLVAHLHQQRSWLARVLSAPGVYFLGEISYAVYLLHEPCHLAVLKLLSPALVYEGLPALSGLSAGLVSGAACLCLSWIAFIVVERPARRFVLDPFRRRRRLAPTMSEPAAP